MNIHRELIIDKNHQNLVKERDGINVVSAIFLSFLYAFSFIPLNFNDMNKTTFLLSYILFMGFSMEFYMMPLLKTKENGKQVWIFEKYRFSPTTEKAMFQSKIKFLSRFLIKHGLITQLIQLITATILYLTENERYEFYNLTPLTIAIVLGLMKTSEIAWYAFHNKEK